MNVLYLGSNEKKDAGKKTRTKLKHDLLKGSRK